MGKLHRREILDHRIDDDCVDGSRLELLELLWSNDGDIRATGVAGGQASSHCWRTVAKKQMTTRSSQLMCIERIPAPLVYDPCAGARHVVEEVARDSFVVHALVAGTDVNRRLLLPVFSPRHDATDGCEARFTPA